MNVILNVMWGVLIFGIGFMLGFNIAIDNYDKRMDVIEVKSTYCEANEIKAFYDNRTYEFHKGELNAKQYRDSLYSDLQKHMIFNKR